MRRCSRVYRSNEKSSKNYEYCISFMNHVMEMVIILVIYPGSFVNESNSTWTNWRKKLHMEHSRIVFIHWSQMVVFLLASFRDRTSSNKRKEKKRANSTVTNLLPYIHFPLYFLSLLCRLKGHLHLSFPL